MIIRLPHISCDDDLKVLSRGGINIKERKAEEVKDKGSSYIESIVISSSFDGHKFEVDPFHLESSPSYLKNTFVKDINMYNKGVLRATYHKGEDKNEKDAYDRGDYVLIEEVNEHNVHAVSPAWLKIVSLSNAKKDLEREIEATESRLDEMNRILFTLSDRDFDYTNYDLSNISYKDSIRTILDFFTRKPVVKLFIKKDSYYIVMKRTLEDSPSLKAFGDKRFYGKINLLHTSSRYDVELEDRITGVTYRFDSDTISSICLPDEKELTLYKDTVEKVRRVARRRENEKKKAQLQEEIEKMQEAIKNLEDEEIHND